MPITINAAGATSSVELPEFRITVRTQGVELTHVASPTIRRACTPHIVEATAGLVRAIRLTLPTGESILATTGRRVPIADRDARWHIHTDDLQCENGIVRLGNRWIWLKHPDGVDSQLPESRTIHATWGDISLTKEVRSAAGDITRPGLRLPQVGALHALAAHWTVERTAPALLVLPTGTGKTEVMIASMIMHRPSRLLVLVPSDPLRLQTAQKFSSLGVLYGTNVVPDSCKCPIVGIPLRAPSTDADRMELRRANIVISTVAMLQLLTDQSLDAFIQLFDTVYFDEAHHVPASTWKRVFSRLGSQRTAGFTATPFRLDGERVPGKIIYQFPLRQAQEHGYFRKINFVAVDEPDTAVADREIATKAIEQLRSDRAAGLQHVLLARAANKMRAEHLFEHIYCEIAPDLSPVLIHSGVKQRRALMKAVRDGAHQIIVCVDMFGEGFDMPALKIAAMHDIHKSLAITLQFTGRFTRTDRRFGSATLIANVGDSRVQEAIEELYSEDADWNLLIPELSARANVGHVELSEFLDQMQTVGPDQGAFDLGMLRPKTSTVIYRAPRFSPRLYRNALRRQSKVHRAWISRDRDLCVFITATALPIDWASVKEVNDEVWDLFVLLYDKDRELLYIHSSQKSTLHGALANAVTENRAQLISGEQMFRALSGFSRLVFQNVGLYGRGKMRFRMFTGYDVSEAISPITQAGSVKSNIFGVGYENGRRGSIGVSYKGRLWSMTSSSIPEWRKWCQSVATKVLDERIETDGFLAHTLVPSEIDALPVSPILAVLMPDEWLFAPDEIRLNANLTAFPVDAVSPSSWNRISPQQVELIIAFGENLTINFDMQWSQRGFQVRQTTRIPVTIDLGEGAISVAEHLTANPPILLLANGSEVRGARLLAYPEQLPHLFDVNQVRVINWQGVPLRFESKWKNGVMRPASVQGRLIEERIQCENTFVIDDDDAGEAADVVEILQGEHEVLFRLYHCKYAHGQEPGVRTADLYEVCGQAIRSSRLISNPEALLQHLERRETKGLLNGRPTRFEKGDVNGLRKLRRRIDRFRSKFEIAIVQPGLSRVALTPEAATVLAAADGFVREFTGTPLVVYASD